MAIFFMLNCDKMDNFLHHHFDNNKMVWIAITSSRMAPKKLRYQYQTIVSEKFPLFKCQNRDDKYNPPILYFVPSGEIVTNSPRVCPSTSDWTIITWTVASH